MLVFFGMAYSACVCMSVITGDGSEWMARKKFDKNSVHLIKIYAHLIWLVMGVFACL